MMTMPDITCGRRLAIAATAGALAAGIVAAPANSASPQVSPSAAVTASVVTGAAKVATADPPPRCKNRKCYMKWYKKTREKQARENAKRWLKRQWEDWFSLDPWKRERDRGEHIGPFKEGRPRVDPDHEPGPPRN